jgi:hypothetical protein
LTDDDDDEESFSSVESPHSETDAARHERIGDSTNARTSRNTYALGLREQSLRGSKVFEGAKSDMLETGGRESSSLATPPHPPPT